MPPLWMHKGTMNPFVRTSNAMISMGVVAPQEPLTADPVTMRFILYTPDEPPVWTMKRKLKNSHVI